MEKVSGVPKYETIVSGLALQLAIQKRLPLYGIRPATLGILYAAAKGTTISSNVPYTK